MEFPDLGKHCSEKTCKQLDFLPVKCDACKQDFCKDHFTYAAHKCPFAFQKVIHSFETLSPKKERLVEVTLLSQIFTYRCSKEGCKKKEMLQMACAQCHSNFCIQHRHPLDHSCRHGSRPTVKAG
uniref:Zinc finger AN1-type containing 2A n=1 Tax=Rhinopithecus roxellana TaxID=61622 RepID=A0A2K6PUC4_RHIRO